MISHYTLLVAQQLKFWKIYFCHTNQTFSWFPNNQAKVNDDNYHIFLSSPGEAENKTINLSNVKKLLGIHIAYKLKCDTHVETISKKDHRKLIVLLRLSNYNGLPKRRIIMNVFFKV